MSSYDFYMLLRSLDELLSRLMPLLIILTAGLVALVLLRVWIKRRPADRFDEQMLDLQRRVERLEERLPPDSR